QGTRPCWGGNPGRERHGRKPAGAEKGKTPKRANPPQPPPQVGALGVATSRSVWASRTAQRVRSVPMTAGSVTAGKSRAITDGAQIPTATSQKWKRGEPPTTTLQRPIV